MENETWRDIPEWEGRYQVSDLGRVRSLRRRVLNSHGWWTTVPGRVLRPAHLSGYPAVTLCKDGVPNQVIDGHQSAVR